MAHRKSTLEKPDAQFLALAVLIDTQSAAHSAEWQLDAEQVAMLHTLVTAADTSYVANSELATRNRITSTAKKAAFSELKQFLGIYINALKGNLHVPEEALIFMGLRPRVHHASQPLPPPGEAPTLSVVRRHGAITVYVARSEHSHPTATAGPKKYGGFMLRWKFEDEAEYKTVISTRLNHTLSFDKRDESRRIVLCAAWINPRLQPGPWSNEIREIIG
jgi:hypothetical protein